MFAINSEELISELANASRTAPDEFKETQLSNLLPSMLNDNFSEGPAITVVNAPPENPITFDQVFDTMFMAESDPDDIDSLNAPGPAGIVYIKKKSQCLQTSKKKKGYKEKNKFSCTAQLLADDELSIPVLYWTRVCDISQS